MGLRVKSVASPCLSEDAISPSSSSQAPSSRHVVDFRRRVVRSSSSESEGSGACGSDAEETRHEEEPPDFGGEFGTLLDDGGEDGEHQPGEVTVGVPLAQQSDPSPPPELIGEEHPGGDDCVAGRKKRHRFGPDEDYMLAVQVNVDEPFKAKHGEVGKKWESLAATLNKSKNFNMHAIKGTTAKARFEALLDKHARFERSSAGKTGVNESERAHVIVMTELATKVKDHMEVAAKAKEDKQNKERAKMTSGEVVREAAVSRLGKRHAETDSSYDEEGASTVSKRKQKQESILAGIFAELNKQRSNVMSEFAQMQHAIAEKASESRVVELDKQLKIEAERTKQRKFELEFEKEQREKDREQQVKLMQLWLQREHQ